MLVNPATGEQATLPLPESGWTALGSPPGSSGYRYSDRHHLFGPCSQAIVTAHRTMVRCSGPGIPFSLDEPSQGSLGVRVNTGSGALSRCVLFGGDIKRDSPGSFLAETAHAPSSCP